MPLWASENEITHKVSVAVPVAAYCSTMVVKCIFTAVKIAQFPVHSVTDLLQETFSMNVYHQCINCQKL